MNSRETFLSSLNQDEIFNIAHAAAKVLRSNPWYQGIPEPVFNLLSDNDGPFARIASKLFRKVGINDIRRLRGDVLMSGRNATSARALNKLQNIVQYLHLCDAPSINCFVHTDLYQQLTHAQGCRNLKTLVLEIHSVDAPLAEIVTAHSSTMEHLKIELKAAAIGSFTIPPTTSLSKLESLDLQRFANLHSLLPVLRTCNDTLTSLFLEDAQPAVSSTGNAQSTDWNAIITFLGNHCHILQELGLVGDGIPMEGYTNLLVNYGSRLTRSNTFWLNAHPNRYAQVLLSCPNLHCEMNNPPECLLAKHYVAPRTSKLCVTIERSNLESWQQFLDRCTSIIDLQIVCDLTSSAVLPKLFRLPKMRLRKVSLFMCNLLLTADALQTVITNAPGMRDLELWVGSFQDHVAIVHVLRSIAVKNLNRVLLWQNELVTQSYALDFSVHVLRAFRSCSQLKELSVTMEMEQTEPRKFKEAIRAECQFFRFRQAKVVVCGAVYFDEEGHRRV